MSTLQSQLSTRQLIAAEAVHGVLTSPLVDKPLSQHRHSYIAEECLAIADSIIQLSGEGGMTPRLTLAAKFITGVMQSLNLGKVLRSNRHASIARECLAIADAILKGGES